MGIASSLFYSTDTEKSTLYRRIIPTEEQFNAQQERWNDLIDYLKGDLYEVTGLSISSWLQGSYKFATQIRPANIFEEFDVDLGVYFSWSGNDGEKYSPKTLKSITQESLKRYKKEIGDEDDIEIESPKNRCSRVKFADNFHIDIPSFHFDTDIDCCALATEDNVWEYSDPEDLYKWFQSQQNDEDSNQLRRMVRYLKMWAALNFTIDKRPSSIVLTILITEAYTTLNSSEKDGDDTALYSCLTKISERLSSNTEVKNPVDNSENLNRLGEDECADFVDNINIFVDLASHAVEADSEFESAIVWQNAFHHFMELPKVDHSEQNNRSLVPVQFVPEVRVGAVSRDNAIFVYSGKNGIGPIPKNCDVSFAIENAHQLPLGSKIQWVVRNEGKDAKFRNDLGHLAGNLLSAAEYSLYKGTHHMDLIVTSPYGQIWGFSRIPVEVTGNLMPLRNPKNKPGYRRFGGKRK